MKATTVNGQSLLLEMTVQHREWKLKIQVRAPPPP